jgi:ABC-type Fe3+ transport system substrate-binding protein
VAIESPASPYEEIAQGAPLSVLLPSVVPSYENYASLAASAPHPDAGKLFMNWLASPSGQDAISKVGGGDYPGAAGAPGPVVNGQQLPGLSGLKTKIMAMESRPGYIAEFNPWSKQWDSIFNYG